MVCTYWESEKMIVEKQGGEDSAIYGERLIEELSTQRSEDF